MTPPASVIDSLAGSERWLRPLYRRVIALILVLICALLALYPEKYRAAATLTPTDPASLGLSGALGQLGAINSVFGNQAAIEVGLKVAKSAKVRRIVIDRMKLIDKRDFRDIQQADRWLKDEMTIRTLRGGILQIEMSDADPAAAQALVTAYTEATRERLSEINRNQTAYKREVLLKLVDDASVRLSSAQNAYDSFRLTNRSADPGFAIASVNARMESIRSTIKSKEVALQATREFATDKNISVQRILAEIVALNAQLREAQTQGSAVPGSVGRVVEESTRLKELERKLAIARGLYDGYSRFLEGTAVEDLTSTANVRILEPPFVDSSRQYNLVPLLAGILILLAALAVEFYQIRRPVGAAARAYDA